MNFKFQISNFKFPIINQKGFSLLEIILASAIFLILATGGTIIITQSYNANRLGEELTVASQFAAEGIEAVKSIKNQAFTNLVNSNGTGVARVGNTWAFSGTNNTLTHNASDNYTRVITVQSVNRDSSPPEGNIAVSGTNDPDTKKITSTVTWNFKGTTQETVTHSTYLSDFEKPITLAGNAIIIYGDSTSPNQPKFRTYNNSSNVFSSEGTAGTTYSDSAIGENFFTRSNPTKNEIISAYVNGNGDLRVLCFDGASWSSEWTINVGGNASNDRRFNIAFERNSGDAFIIYSTNTVNNNEMAYRTKPGTSGCGSANWSGATNVSAARTNGVVHWIRTESSPLTSSNNIAVAWADSNSDLSAMIWTGSGFTIAEPALALETNLERVSASQDVLSFDIAYESLTGNLMVVWGLFQSSGCTAGTTIATTNCIRYARYTTSWSSVAVIPTVADPATNIDAASNPNTNELVISALDNTQNDLSIAYWSGSTWTGRANVDTSSEPVTAGTKRVASGWLISGSNTRSIVVYHDVNASNIGWVVGNGSTFTVQSDFNPTPLIARPSTWYRVDTDPFNKDRLMLTVTDNRSDLFAKRLVMSSAGAFTWTNADGGVALENSLGQATTRSFGFTYYKNP